ncbi:hypothetical protein NDU88_006296 [Pleurodeles waltl]|uniref:Uncharacterized protein n=1 Tax=Pleurodeles waltl TaxID=8319 RepID=A0AAV7TX85_PLEWA|nr:hypothetical protein NDU88_006296 [Pleurodeles waltl]
MFLSKRHQRDPEKGDCPRTEEQRVPDLLVNAMPGGSPSPVWWKAGGAHDDGGRLLEVEKEEVGPCIRRRRQTGSRCLCAHREEESRAKTNRAPGVEGHRGEVRAKVLNPAPDPRALRDLCVRREEENRAEPERASRGSGQTTPITLIERGIQCAATGGVATFAEAGAAEPETHTLAECPARQDQAELRHYSIRKKSSPGVFNRGHEEGRQRVRATGPNGMQLQRSGEGNGGGIRGPDEHRTLGAQAPGT